MICDNCLKETNKIYQLSPTSSWGLCLECYKRIKRLDGMKLFEAGLETSLDLFKDVFAEQSKTAIKKVGDFKGGCDEPCDDDPNLKDLGSQIVDEIRKINGCGPDVYLNG